MLSYLLLPIYALLSLARMFLAYVLSLIFALSVGILAGRNRRAEGIIIPILDVLQSVPILGFFPVAILFFVNLFGTRIGGELSSIFLIFTSLAWNMTFGVYESVKLIPREIEEMSEIYGIRGTLYLRKILIPSTTTKLIYNSAMSWAGGWFFLYASEVISVSNAEVSLPGLGSLLAQSLAETPPRLDLAAASVFAIMLLVAASYLLLWRPLIEWSENFKYEYAGGGRRALEIPAIKVPASLFRISLRYIRRILKLMRLRELLERVGNAIERRLSIIARVIEFILAIFLIYAIVKTACSVKPEYLASEYIGKPGLVALASLNSLRRVALVLLLALSWSIPLSILLGRSRHWNELMLGLELAASFPVPVLWPFLVSYIVLPLGDAGFEVAVITLALFGAQFYVLFNSLAGFRSIPADLEEMRRIFLIRGSLYLRKIVLPAMFPSLVTGLITAWGGAWNTLIVAEYIRVGGNVFPRDEFQYGLGTLLSLAAWEKGDVPSLILITAVLTSIVVAVNRTFWRFLYNFSARFRVE